MLTKYDGYLIIKERSKTPVTYLIEGENDFFSVADEFLSVDKSSGEIKKIDRYIEYLHALDGGVYVFVEQMFDDFLDYYKNHNSEEYLAMIYAEASDRLYYHLHENAKEFINEEERQQLIDGWRNVEQVLYADIRMRMDKEDYYYPPCVLNKMDDPFYRIKPFMNKNGWTDAMSDKTWVRKYD